MNDQMIELFLQGEGIPDIKLIRVPQDCTVRELIGKVRTESGAQHEEEIVLLLEDQDKELTLDAKLTEAGIGHRQRIHCHRCRRVEVTVNFNTATKVHVFSPAHTIGKIKRWADDQFGLKGVDATEHALQICGTSTRPDHDVHVGSLVQHPNCKVCFDFVPKKRVEG